MNTATTSMPEHFLRFHHAEEDQWNLNMEGGKALLPLLFTN
jgi:hypothetical protein